MGCVPMPLEGDTMADLGGVVGVLEGSKGGGSTKVPSQADGTRTEGYEGTAVRRGTNQMAAL